ncbi:MAG: tetratricopeptide repeat protein [Mariprofundales bacterium]|nr:tetratricopeptide repeat protein [Mariprofundales bacterium]
MITCHNLQTKYASATPCALTIALLLLGTLAACQPIKHIDAAQAHHRTNPSHTSALPSHHIPLQQLEPEFLFMAAQDAIDQGQLGDAARYLNIVVAKDPYTALPQAQLAEALLKDGQAKASLPHFHALFDPTTQLPQQLNDQEKLRLRLLQTTAQLASKDITGAQATLELVIKHHPNYLPARLEMAKIYQLEGNPDGALELLAKGIKRHDDPQLRRMQIEILLQQGRPKQAQRALQAVHTLAPDNAAIAIIISQFAKKMHQPAKAEQGLRNFLSHHPNNLPVTKELASMLVHEGRLPEAVVLYQQLLKRNSDQHEVRLTLGLLYYQNKHYSKAEATFATIISDAGIFYRAASIEAQKRDKEARALYQKISNGSNMFTQAQLRLAAIDLRTDRIPHALASVRTLLQGKRLTHQERNDAWSILSAVLLQQEHYQQLIDETAPALDEPNTSPQLLFNRAVAFEHFKRYDQAEQMIDAQLKQTPNDPESLNFLGYMLAEQGIRLDEAEQLIRRALNSEADNGYYLDSLAWVHYRRGEYQTAIKIQLRALKQIKNDPIMLEHLGDMQWRHGDQEAAKTTWRHALAAKHPQPKEIKRKIAQGL